MCPCLDKDSEEKSAFSTKLLLLSTSSHLHLSSDLDINMMSASSLFGNMHHKGPEAL